MATLRQMWDRWQSRLLRHRVTRLENELKTLRGHHKAQMRAVNGALVALYRMVVEELKADSEAAGKRLLEHAAMLSALAQLNDQNPARARELRRLYEEQLAARRPPPPAEPSPVEEPPADAGARESVLGQALAGTVGLEAGGAP